MSYTEAISYCVRAQRSERDGRFHQALIFYQEGLIRFLTEYKKDDDYRSRQTMAKIMQRYIEKAEHVKTLLSMPEVPLSTIEEEEEEPIKTEPQLT
jgi:predicted amidophosphoribosyltransferase